MLLRGVLSQHFMVKCLNKSLLIRNVFPATKTNQLISIFSEHKNEFKRESFYCLYFHCEKTIETYTLGRV